MMSIREIEYFLTLVEEGNITTAAKRLHIAQPPLSRQMKQLEDNLGAKLFERGHRRIQLTEAGQLLKNKAEQLLELMKATVKEIKEIEAGTHGTLAIGIASSSVGPILSRVIRVFHRQYPGLKFELREGESIEVLELLAGGLIEIGIVRFAYDDDIYESINLPSESLVAVFNKNYPAVVGTGRDTISLSELAGKPLMIHRKFEAMITVHCHHVGFEPYFFCKSDDDMPVLAWADANMGIAVVPKTAVDFIPNANLIYKTITNPVIETNAAVVWMRDRYLSAAARHFLSLFTTQGSLTGSL
jgi:DNA-binding transcriptional LysR family regulator